MKMHLVALGAAVSLTLGGGAALAEQKPGHRADYQHGAGSVAESLHADMKTYQACPHCGMDRRKYDYSRMLITYSDGSSAGVCSIHCAATELKASKGKTVKVVEVADLNSKKLVEAEKATWVIGGSRKGIMTQAPKWAFAKKDDAAEFIGMYGGRQATYNEALTLAEKE
jgi:nitrous oxide reductase accessory protein NosL